MCSMGKMILFTTCSQRFHVLLIFVLSCQHVEPNLVKTNKRPDVVCWLQSLVLGVMSLMGLFVHSILVVDRLNLHLR